MVLFFFCRQYQSPLAQSVPTVIVTVLWYKVYVPSLSESCGIKCTYCHCCGPSAQSVPIIIGSNVIFTVLWQKVYPLSLSESFGTNCTYRHCHSFFGRKCIHRHCLSPLAQSVSTVIVSPLAQSVPTLIVTVPWHKVYRPSLSDSCGINVVRFFLILPRFFGAWPFFYSFPRLFGVWPFFFVSLSRLFGAWSCFFIFYAVNIRVLWYKVYLPSLSESCGIKCTHCHCCCSLAQSVPIVIGSNVVVTVLWQKVYPLSLAESFGTKCTYRHCHSSLVESVSIVIVWVLWHKVYLLLLSQFFGTKCTHPHCHSLLSQSLSTVIVRLLWHKSGPFFSNSTTFFWSVAFFLHFSTSLRSVAFFLVILSRLFGTWSCFLHFTLSTSESFGGKCIYRHCQSPVA